MPDYRYTKINTPRGVFLVKFSPAGIYEINFPGLRHEPDITCSELPWPKLDHDLNLYFQGTWVAFEGYPLDLSGYPTFVTAVLMEVSKVPYGHVITYRQAAELAGSPLAWRAAGQALKSNRHPLVIPCHRVISSSGKTGGFSGPRGWKEMLLQLEGVDLKG